jgi:hypothetical protein
VFRSDEGSQAAMRVRKPTFALDIAGVHRGREVNSAKEYGMRRRMEHRRLKPARRCCFMVGGWSKRAREVHSIVTNEILAAISGRGTERSVIPSELIKKVWDAHPLICPKCQGEMRDCGLITNTPSSRRSKARTQFLQACEPRSAARMQTAIATGELFHKL